MSDISQYVGPCQYIEAQAAYWSRVYQEAIDNGAPEANLQAITKEMQAVEKSLSACLVSHGGRAPVINHDPIVFQPS